MGLFGNKEPKIVRLDESIIPAEIKKLETELKAQVVGQDRAISQFVRVHETYMAGLQSPNKPIGVFLFAGPTGVGKTHVVQRFCDIMKVNLIKLDCGEYQHSHEISKLIGSPPGYVGGEIPLPINEDTLKPREGSPQYTVILLDEIEKAHAAVHQIMLGMMEGTLTTGKNVKISLKNTIIVMTSNLGSASIKQVLEAKNAWGFKKEDGATSEQDVYAVTKKAIKSFFSAEFFNRIDRVVVFQPLSKESARKILNLELNNLQDRIMRANKFVGVEVSERAKDFLIEEGISPELGARELKRVIEKLLTAKLARAFSTNAAQDGDIIIADKEPGTDKLVIDISKSAMEVPKPVPPTPVMKQEHKQPKRVFVPPSNPDAKGPFKNPDNEEYCGRCGYHWHDKHECADLVELSPFEKFRRDWKPKNCLEM